MNEKLTKPLAEILRPKKVDDIIGQIELLGEGQSLKVAIEGNNLPSMILGALLELVKLLLQMSFQTV